MSKIRDLPEATSLDGNDLLYVVDTSAGPNGGKKITKDNLKTAVAQTPAEIKTAYESNADTNAFTDAEKTKLANIDPDAAEDFKPSIVTGRIMGYTQGTVRYDGVFYELAASQILLNANITDGYVYVDLDGIVKQTASSVLPPPYTVVIARFSTDLNNIVGLQDQRSKTEQNLVRGSSGDITSISAGVSAVGGTSGKITDAAHVHSILTAAPSTQNADQANAEGASNSLARADHTHNIPTAAPVSVGTANAQGSANTFSKSDHVHAHGNQLGGSLHAEATQSTAGFMPSADKTTVDLLREIQVLTNEPTGFPNRTDSAISFDNPSRTFTIQPTGADFDYWIAGSKYTVTTPQSIQISDSTGLHFVWFDANGNIQTSFGQPFVDVFIQPIAFISVLYWNSTMQEVIILGDERHGMTMDNASHRFVNNAFGATFNSGLAINTIVPDGDGSLNSSAQFSVQDGSFFDEDILFEITDGNPQDLSPAAVLPVLYRLGGSGHWYRKTANIYPIIYNGTAGYTGANGRIPFNEFDGANWVLTEADENNYVWLHVLVCNDATNPVVAIQGIEQYASVALARDSLESEISGLGSLAAREQVVIGSVLYKTSASYTNATKAVISSVFGANYVDFRQVLVQVAGASNDHSSLANLQADTHPQYLNRSGVRPMTGDLDMGSFSITSVNLVDGVDVSSHASRHNPGGADAVSTAIAVGLNADSVNAEGNATSLARSNHTHAIATGAPSTQNADQANAAGVSANLARADHVHNIPTAAPSTSSTSSANTQGSANTFAKSDHVHAIQVANQNATATVDDTTTSTTDTLMAGMTLTPAAGSYFVVWSGSLVNSGNGAERNWVSIYAGGVQVTATERVMGQAGGSWATMSTQGVVTVNGSQAIEIRWRVAAGTGRVRQRRLSLLRVG